MKSALLSESDLDRLIDAIYVNALDRQGWSRTAGKLTEALRGALVFFHLPNAYRPEIPDVVLPEGAGIDLDPYFDHYINVDPALPYAHLIGVQSFQWPHELMPLSKLLRTECYSDYYIPNDVYPGPAACIDADSDFGTSRLMLANRTRNPSITPDDEVYLRPLLPHLRRAVGMYCRVRSALETSALLAESLDLLPTAVFIVDTESAIRFANRAGQALLRARDGIRSRGRFIEGESPSSARELRRTIHSTLSSSPATRDSTGSVRLPRGSGLRALEAIVCPVAGHHVDSPVPRLVIVIVSDPESRVDPKSRVLGDFYGLTPAESLLAVELANGSSLAEAADRLRITQNTARSRMKVIFEKTSTQRQAELVRLMLNGLLGRVASTGEGAAETSD